MKNVLGGFYLLYRFCCCKYFVKFSDLYTTHMRKILIYITIGLLSLLAAIWLIPSTRYLIKTAIYQEPGIYDRSVFAEAQVAVNKSSLELPTGLGFGKVIPDTLLQSMAGYETTAFLVVKDSTVICERYSLDGDRDTLSNSFSAAKSIVAILVGAAIVDGKIKSVDDPISNYIAEFKNSEVGAVTVKELLTMSSGIRWDEGYSSLFSVVTKAYYGSNLDEQMLALKVKEKPGVKFEYQSCNTQLLAMVVERATGMDLASYTSVKLWTKIGATQSAHWSLDADGGAAKAYCCFYATARDFSRIGLLILNQGKTVAGQPVVDSTYFNQMISPASNLVDAGGKAVDFYGYQWWLVRYRNKDVYYARGILGQYIFVIPSDNMVVVRLGHQRSKVKVGQHPNDIFVYLDAAFALLKN